MTRAQHASQNAMIDPGEIDRFYDRCSDLMRELLDALADAPDRPRTFPQIEDAMGWPRRRIASVLGGVFRLRQSEFGGRRPYRFHDEHQSASGRWEMWMDGAQARVVQAARRNHPDEEDAHLDRVLIGGREPVRIVIADARPDWPARFARESARIRAALRGAVGRVEHIGSTAVPGLAAKPIVDILVTVDDAGDEPAFVPALERAGYLLRVREPGHRMLRTPHRDVHVHVWGRSDPEVDRHLAFRDRLRASPEDRRAYERLKRELATRDWTDMNHYAQAKDDLIDAILGPASPARR